MKTATYQQFAKTNNAALNFHFAMEACREQKIHKLVVEKDIYEIDPIYCDQRIVNMSNHDDNGPKRIGVLIEEMEDFEIDFNGSTLLCKGVVTPISVLNSKGICVRNVKIKNPTTPLWCCKVIAHGENYVDVQSQYGEETMNFLNGHIFGKTEDKFLVVPIVNNIEFDGNSELGSLARGTADETFGCCNNKDLIFEPMGEGQVRIRGGKRKPPIGNILLFQGDRRVGASIFYENCQNLIFEQVDLCSGYGMGIIAQICTNITLRHFNTRREDGRLCTIGADATHFVNCSGRVLVEDCEFIGQMDDALNMQGVYATLTYKSDHWIIAREMHCQATGINIFHPGNKLQFLPSDTLLPYTEKTICSAKMLNDFCALVEFK